jgi:hypothetical protein
MGAVAGGCQCGAVRYRVEGALTNAHICHCRMCQKAAGNFFMPLANAQNDQFVVTRGEISWFDSSDRVRRGFCRDCGTPLIYKSIDARHLNVTIGSLDDPAACKPRTQDGVESRIGWFADLARLPEIFSDPGLCANNRQHPDDDAARWEP